MTLVQSLVRKDQDPWVLQHTMRHGDPCWQNSATYQSRTCTSSRTSSSTAGAQHLLDCDQGICCQSSISGAMQIEPSNSRSNLNIIASTNQQEVIQETTCSSFTKTQLLRSRRLSRNRVLLELTLYDLKLWSKRDRMDDARFVPNTELTRPLELA